MSFNLATMLRESARATPDKPFARFMGTSTTFAQLDHQSGLFAAGLLARGLKPGDAVAVQLPNLPHFLVSYFGIMKAGLRMVPINPLLKAAEIAYHLGDSDSKLLITFEVMLPDAMPGAATVDVPVFVVSLSGQPMPEGVGLFAELLADEVIGEPGGEIFPTNSDDTAVIIYTSGTTGKPKGAELTHFELYMNCSVAGSLFGARDDDITLAVLPFFHVFGLSSIINVNVRFGGTMALVPRFDPVAVLDVLEAERVTVIGGVPTMLHALALMDISGRDLSALRVAISGGASLPGEIMRTFEEKYGIVILEGYGLSETASTATFNPSAEVRKVLSIGKPIWGVELRVGDANDQPLPPGPDNVGEILIRGHNVMKGYLGRPAETADAFRNGWFHSGDLGYVDDEGFYFVVDRSKDLVIRGGYNVYPREIEEVLFEHSEIVEAAVIGRADDHLGEEVVAVVVLTDSSTLTEADIVAWTKERMAAYKYPREIRFVKALPKGATGKVLKTELRTG